ncbi:MAG: hypothetical protein QM804_02300 [Propionicimonas sp.]
MTDPTPPAALRPLLLDPPEQTNLVLPWSYAAAEDWTPFQLGYRVHGNTGDPLVSETDGDWQPDWWVIAANYFADPFFIDLREDAEGFPVRYAPHGAGRWDAQVVAGSVAEFAAWLRTLAELSDRPLEAARFAETCLPYSEFWAEVAESYREDAAES